MNQDTVTTVTSFKASVAGSMLDIIDRIFDNSPSTVWTELLQNSRRSGATSVEAGKTEENGWYYYQDNGPGIDDPSILFALRGSGWDQQTRESEDPAGMGFFVLSNMDEVVIRSRGWMIRTNRKGFSGKEEIVMTDDPEPVEGLRVEFKGFTCHRVDIADAYKIAVELGQLNARWERKEVERINLRRLALRTLEVDDLGVRIFVVDGRVCPIFREWNFYGCRFSDVDLPNLDWLKVVVDVYHCREVKLTLPSRASVVRGEAYERVKHEARRALYECAETRSAELNISHSAWERAREFGIELPYPPVSLISFGGGLIKSDGSELIVDDSLVCGKGHWCVSTAARALTVFGGQKLCLAASEKVGFPAYDRLAVVTDIAVKIDGETYDPWSANKPDAVDSVVVEVTVSHGGVSKTMCLETDVVFGPSTGYATGYDDDDNLGEELAKSVIVRRGCIVSDSLVRAIIRYYDSSSINDRSIIKQVENYLHVKSGSGEGALRDSLMEVLKRWHSYSGGVNIFNHIRIAPEGTDGEFNIEIIR